MRQEISSVDLNRKLVTDAMTALAAGDRLPFRAMVAEDCCWIVEGTTAWSGTYSGKAAIINRLIAPLFAQFATTYRNRPERIIADGDTVVVLCRGGVETKSGERYDNSYCYVITMRDGQMVELREYLDTALVERVLGPPALND